jgi:hypothetical protein
MTYTNNVPQANQKISTTQPIIEANFVYLQNAIGQEHNFPANATNAEATYHLQASMPGQVDPGALPAGTNGIYYVDQSSPALPKFYNGTANFLWETPIQQFYDQQTHLVPNNPLFVNMYTFSPNTFGTFYITRDAHISTGIVGQFLTDNNNHLITNPFPLTFPNFIIDIVNTTIQLSSTTGAAFNATIRVFYFTY